MRQQPELFRVHGYPVDRILRPGDGFKPRVLRAWSAGRPIVIKDLTPMRPEVRWLYGRRLLQREARALERLGPTGVSPRLIARLGRDGIAVEWVPTGRRKNYLRKNIGEERMARVLRAMEVGIARMHGEGIVHLDLRQRKNILVLPDDRVVFVDFESSRFLPRPFGLRRLLLPWLGAVDRNAVLKWKAKYLPDAMTPEERARFGRFQRWRRIWVFKRLARRMRHWMRKR